MKKEDTAAEAAKETPVPLPTHVAAGVSPEFAKLRVLDAETGKRIAHVLEADTEKGFVRRYAVEGGNFVREGSDLKVIEEERKVRLEWIGDAA
ncbi:hypothetical protein [Sphingomonas desiccabilis]|uniref:Uncharacterized protein n=1 Tax=Sphingomonas desiccabilis TaxID=429134 RepID=A0A4Q2J242_9SPHN|nr:hypothetical protein [Sphingomonas desiccabilis]MBB3910837.1 glyceraldehyde-3-phosphate dehydrogenase/erythrose-4-phosphate dehydrogenase [Sphingomonas desiccabilis]RXZ35442.1 hypothetical protein EO081_07445 [Sphingomonas desiccabilis]